ncbi:MAG: C/D box methylation guide ribonucleoprotein complex aNOP56 subunit [Candidatus Thermoplasmatota archaeon]
MDEEKEDADRILYTTWFGTFIIENEEVIDKELFSKDADELAEKKFKREDGEILDEEKELSQRWDEVQVASERLEEMGTLYEGKIENIEIDSKEYSFDDSLLQEALLKLGSKKVRESIDFGEHLAKAVDTIQDLNEIINIKMERLRDWYSLHFPELESEVDDEDYVGLIAQCGSRREIRKNADLDLDEDHTGGEITDREVELYQRLAEGIKDDMDHRKEVHDYVEKRMEEYAPNLAALTGPKLGGELIALVGSLEELAKKPASTIQVLGAEKALFKHLDKGTDPPKHGAILQHPYVHRAPKDKRGKIARTFANKIAIAARLDYFGGDYKGDELKEQVEEKIEQIKKE